MFGIALEELMATREQGRDVPMILEKTIGWLTANNATHVEGLFRIPGMMTEIQHYRHLCDQARTSYPVQLTRHPFNAATTIGSRLGFPNGSGSARRIRAAQVVDSGTARTPYNISPL